MNRITLSPIILAALITSFPDSIQAKTPNSLTAQLFYPPPHEKSTIQVIGRGRVTQPADSAQLKFNFNPNVPESSVTGTLSQFGQTRTPLTQESFQPIVDALVAIGVPTEAISVTILTPNSDSFSFPFPFPSTESEAAAQVAVTLETVTKERIRNIVDQVNKITNQSQEFNLAGVKIDFKVKNCEALEREAYVAAVKDAQNRANAIALGLEAEVLAVPSIAEPFYNIFIPTCNADGNLSFSQSPSDYDPNAPLEVEITKEVFVTYTFKQ